MEALALEQMLLVKELKVDIVAMILGRLAPLCVGMRLENPLTDDKPLILADKVCVGVEVLEGSLDGEAVKVGFVLLLTVVFPVVDAGMLMEAENDQVGVAAEVVLAETHTEDDLFEERLACDKVTLAEKDLKEAKEE